jgi:hypothetical protein
VQRIGNTDVVNAILLLAFSISYGDNMSSGQDWRVLGNSIAALLEKVELLKEYAKVLLQDTSKFDSNQFLKYTGRIEDAARECKTSYDNYVNR